MHVIFVLLYLAKKRTPLTCATLHTRGGALVPPVIDGLVEDCLMLFFDHRETLVKKTWGGST